MTATVADFIKEGVEEVDWNKICIAYEAMTGEHLEPPAAPEEPPIPVNLGSIQIPDHLLTQTDLTFEEVFDDELKKVEETNDVIAEEFPYQYICSNCNHEWHYSKPRVRCASCNKHTLEPKKKEMNLSSEQSLSTRTGTSKFSDFIAPSRDTDASEGGTLTNEEGQTEARKVAFNLHDRRALSGKSAILETPWIDNKTDDMKDSSSENPALAAMYGKKTTKDRSNKSRETGKKTQVQCSLCSSKFVVLTSYARGYDTNPEHNRWKCNDCLSTGSRKKKVTHGSS